MWEFRFFFCRKLHFLQKEAGEVPISSTKIVSGIQVLHISISVTEPFTLKNVGSIIPCGLEQEVMDGMDSITSSLMEELNSETVFTIPIFGGIPILESVVVTWIIMAVILILCLILTRGLRVENPSKKQVILEMGVSSLCNFFDDTLGEAGGRYGPYLMSVLIYVAFANLIGIIGFKPPTKDINVTIALSVMSIILIEAACIKAKGGLGWLKSKAEPMAVLAPINFLEILIRPLSLCMRLFGNVLGSFIIMELLKLVVPAVVPAVASLYFDIFDGLIQAYVFVFLTSLFLKEGIE